MRNVIANRPSPIQRAVRTVLGAAVVGAGFSAPSVAVAQQQETQLREIIVTGSLIRRTDEETASPVTVVTAESLEERGINTISEAIQRLSANNAGTIQQGWNTGFNFASGANAPALRGLTVQSTLSVADGLRLAPYPLADDGQRNFVDLNTIPNAIVERIEVLRDGASSTYGADAIAGVVNIITKKEITGLHLGGSYGFAEEGGGAERQFDITYGLGDLVQDGYNFYVSGEYYNQEALWARQREHPFNTGNLTGICGPTGSCMTNHNWNGLTPELGSDPSAFNGLFSIPGVPLVRPVPTGVNVGSARYQYLNPAAGCRQWRTITIAAGQSATSPLSTCEVDIQNAYIMLQPEIERMGLSSRFTADLNDDTQMYAMVNFYKTTTYASFTPLGFNGTLPPPTPAGLASANVILPEYVCAQGVGTFNGLNTGCTAANGVLNPYNPFAASGERAQLLLRSPYGREVETNSRAVRGVLGVDGMAWEDWHYTASLTTSEVGLTRIERNYMIPQRIWDVAARGNFNFADPYANSREIWDYIAPPNNKYSPSRLWQAQATVDRKLMDLSGGPLQALVGASYRDESIEAPSGNPANDSAPYTRHYSINAVGTRGSRDVMSAFFEIDAPVLDMLELSASGRYDDYSTGQSNFSPKLGFKVTPIEQVAVRGTWSKGFRIPSFNEAFGLPTTGYVSRTVSCTQFPAYCAAHGGNAYASGTYNVGLTQTGNPGLDPEKSTSLTFGIVAEPMERLSLTLDYWRIKVEGLITGITDTEDAETAYYANNGVVNLPNITVLPGTPDPAFPNALPQLGFIQTSYQNQDQQVVSGIDLAVNYSMPIASFNWKSSLEVSYLSKYELRSDTGEVYRYEGTLSPCNITSCSGAPDYRASWQNTVEITEDTSATLTAYYTSGYDTASLDFGGIRGDCEGNAAAHTSTESYVDGTPVNCKSDDIWNVDLTVRHRLTDSITLQADVLNVLDIEAPFDPSAAYGLFWFNPAWAGPNIMGRYFRLKARVQF